MKELREKAGFSIDEVSVSTRISHSYVEALENGDFEKLPGVVFVKGFVKNLIKTYGVRDMDVIAKLDLVYRQKRENTSILQLLMKISSSLWLRKRNTRGILLELDFKILF